jgi:regulator of protease activity HflC (stomatin/prohibitin superfamily)
VFEKARVVGSLDIIWIKSGQQPVKWGVGNVISLDGITVSGRGILYARVADGVKFNTQVLQGSVTFSEVDLQRFLMPRLQSVMRTVVAVLPARALMVEREAFFNAIKNNLGDSFAEMGLQIVDIEVMDVNLPAEYKAAISQEAMVGAAQGARLLEAQIAAQERLIEAQATAQANLSLGAAEVQLLTTLQAQGIDPLKLKALEAMQTMAENPSHGGLGGADAARVAIIGQVAGSALATPAQPTIPQPAALPLPQAPSMIAQQPQAPVAAPQQEGAVEVDAARIAALEEKLEKLEDRLLDGEISEEMYTKLAAKIEARLEKLRA